MNRFRFYLTFNEIWVVVGKGTQHNGESLAAAPRSRPRNLHGRLTEPIENTMPPTQLCDEKITLERGEKKKKTS